MYLYNSTGHESGRAATLGFRISARISSLPQPRISKWRAGLFSRVSIENELTPHRVIESGRV